MKQYRDRELFGAFCLNYLFAVVADGAIAEVAFFKFTNWEASHKGKVSPNVWCIRY